ncbi:MAG TPA: hypothetical protein VM840_02130, partial [Actinomycetota bacterium]|nr:hypothetical protein [Actinomycetota bacterium]
EQITESLDEQAARRGTGGSAEDAAREGASPTPPPDPAQVIDQPRVKRCQGQPPRQTEDPQSPPCVPFWDGDNGGATATGVTATEVVIAYPTGGFGEDDAAVGDLARHFNMRYEFYGRRLTIKAFVPDGGSFNHPDPTTMRSDARLVADQLNAFASMAYPDRKGSEHHYYDALTELKVISAAYRGGSQLTEQRLRSKAPYQWNVLPGVDTMFRTYGQFVCRTLKGLPPEHAGPGTRDRSQRKFGIIFTRALDGSVPDLTPLRTELRACGLPDDQVPQVEARHQNATARSGVSEILAMKDEGVTSIVCLCDVGETRNTLMPAASAQTYYPEWLLGSYIDNDLDNSMSQAPPDQRRSVFGATFRNRFGPRDSMPWFWAVKEANPTREVPEGNYYPLASRYAQLLLIASGIQMAGPNLTPETFMRGLQQARFPNPGAGDAPHYQARVGFEPSRHTMTQDATMWWYDPGRRSTVNPADVGAVCYVNRGVRFRHGSWPTGRQAFYQEPCL